MFNVPAPVKQCALAKYGCARSFKGAGLLCATCAPVMAFCAELHKALALMPRVSGVTLSLTLLRNGAVAITPPSFLPLK